MSDRRLVVAEDLFRLKFVSDPQMSPDHQYVVFAVKTIDATKNKYWTHLWRVNADGFSPEARQFTGGEVSDGSPRWNYDDTDRRLAFLRTRDKRTQVWLIGADGGEALPLTRLEEGSLGCLSWSPDNSRLAFTFARTPEEWTQAARQEREKSGASNPPRVHARLQYRLDGFGFLGERRHVWTVEADSGEATSITDGDYDDDGPVWAPDGKHLAFLSNRCDDPDDRPYEHDLWIVPAEGGEPRRIPTPPGYKAGLAWSPDGKFIAYLGAETREDPWTPKNDGVWVVPANSDAPARNLTAALDRTVGNVAISDTREAFGGAGAPVWAADSLSLYCTISDRGAAHLYNVTLEANLTALTSGSTDVSSFSADRSTTRLALALGHALDPGEIHIWSHGETHPLTHLNRAWLDTVQLSEPEEVWLPVSDDLNVQLWIMRPPDFEPARQYPLLLSVHGGPHAQYGHCFFHQFQMHAAEGYVVCYLNPRGSMGREEQFAACIKGDWGNLDYADVMAAADYCATLPEVDAARMSISGGSYGGYMTNWVVGHTDRFRCAITDRSVVNMHSMAGTSDYPFRADGYWKGNMWDNPQPLLDQSPLSHVKNCATPLLIIHSDGDLRCPIGQADELYATLKRLKREVEYVRYPTETSHGLSRTGPPDLRLDRLRRYSAWFAKYLKE